jgi:hypothetical protein
VLARTASPPLPLLSPSTSGFAVCGRINLCSTLATSSVAQRINFSRAFYFLNLPRVSQNRRQTHSDH